MDESAFGSRRYGNALFATQAFADDYPNRPIHVYTTSSAGGISDVFMRVLNDDLQKSLGQPLIIENKPGGGGNLAARVCQDATPDGYTICIINADTILYNQFVFQQIPFDPEKLVPIVNLFHLIQAVVVNSICTSNRWMIWSRCRNKNPARSIILPPRSRVSSTWIALKRDKGADWVRVPFRGGGEKPATAVLGGSTPIAIIGIGNVMGQIKAGKMTALTLVNNKRTPLLPKVPTWADIGYKGAASETFLWIVSAPPARRRLF